MKLLAACPILFAALCCTAQAQTSPAAPKQAETKRAAPQTPADTAKALPQAERIAIQSDLAWVGVYNGGITGEVSERMLNAIKAFQKDHGGKQTGVLNPQERAVLDILAGTTGFAIGADGALTLHAADGRGLVAAR